MFRARLFSYILKKNKRSGLVMFGLLVIETDIKNKERKFASIYYLNCTFVNDVKQNFLKNDSIKYWVVFLCYA